MSDTAPEPEDQESGSNTTEELLGSIIAQFERTLGFSESDVRNAEKLLARTDVNSESWETLLARIADRKEDAS